MLRHKHFSVPITNIIKAVQLTLDQPSTKYPVIIAGGFLRDHVLERQDDDIDVYIDMRMLKSLQDKTFEQVVDIICSQQSNGIKLLDQRQFKVVTLNTHAGNITFTIHPSFGAIVHKPAASYSTTNSTTTLIKNANITNGISSIVTKSIKFPSKDDPQLEFTYKVQFIFINENPIQYVKNNFCCNLSKIYYDGVKTVMLPEFVTGVNDKHLVFRKMGRQSDKYFNTYVEKIKNKYSDFTTIVVS